MSLTAEHAAEVEVSDDDLIVRYRAGAPEALDALLHRYRRYARSRARGYFLVGADADDIEQEGLIGLYKAVQSYQLDGRCSFRSFAELCVTRQVISAVKGANRLKHQPMNRYVSISAVMGGESDHELSIEHLLDDHHVHDPAEDVCQREGVASLKGAMRDLLSGLEAEVLDLYVEGRTYQEIGQSLGRHVKSIDNALQRIKVKLELGLAERAAADQSVT